MADYDFIIALELKYDVEYLYLSEEFTTDSIPFTKNKLLINIDKAYKAICKYLDYAGDKTEEYILPTISLTKAYFNIDKINTDLVKGNRSVTQMSQGSRSVTYRKPTIEIDSEGLTEDVKAMLPLPKLRVI